MMDCECVGCGCTDTRACLNQGQPCHWLLVDKELCIGVCSSCPDKVEVFEQKQKDLYELAQAFVAEREV